MHWLKTYYSKKVEDLNVYAEFSNSHTYVSKKISYLKRPAARQKQSQEMAQEEDMEDGDDEINVQAQVHKAIAAPKKIKKQKMLKREEDIQDADDKIHVQAQMHI